MSQTDKFSRIIADYLYDNMEAEERKEFEDKLQLDPLLNAEFRRQKKVYETLQSEIILEEMESGPDLEDAKRIVDEFYGAQSSEQQLDAQQRNARSKKSIRFSGWAAAIAAAIVLTLIVLRPGGSTNERIYNSFYAPYEYLSLSYRGLEPGQGREFESAVNHYLNAEYQEASGIFASLQAKNQDLKVISFYLGLSKLGEGDFQQAENILEEYVSQDAPFIPEAQWYLALSYLKTGKKQDAVELLNELTKAPGSYSRKAAKALRRLE